MRASSVLLRWRVCLINYKFCVPPRALVPIRPTDERTFFESETRRKLSEPRIHIDFANERTALTGQLHQVVIQHFASILSARCPHGRTHTRRTRTTKILLFWYSVEQRGRANFVIIQLSSIERIIKRRNTEYSALLSVAHQTARREDFFIRFAHRISLVPRFVNEILIHFFIFFPCGVCTVNARSGI